MSHPVLAFTKFVREDTTLLELLVPLLLVGLVVIVSLRGLREMTERLRGRYFRKNHVIVIGTSRIAMQMAAQLFAQGRRVSVIAPGKMNSDAEMLVKKGIHVLTASQTNLEILDKAGLPLAHTCFIATGSDRENLSTAELIREIKRKQGPRRRLRILLHISNTGTLEVMKDNLVPSVQQGNSELIPFNEKKLSAELMYDLTPPYLFLKGEKRLNNEECICVLGFNLVAELFLVENAILSQYPDQRKLKVLLLAKNAGQEAADLLARRPFLADYLSIVPIELVNAAFASAKEWDTKLAETVPAIDAVYCFGDEDPLVFQSAMHFQQFLYARTGKVHEVPVTLCMPEATNISSLLAPARPKGDDRPTVRDLGFHLLHMISDTCTVRNLIDERAVTGQVAMAVNYFYSIRYEFGEILRNEFRQANTVQVLKEIENRLLSFQPKSNAPLAELESLVVDALVAHTKNSAWRIRKFFGIQERWDNLTERKKDANRYVVRHIGNKLRYLENNGTKLITRETLDKQMGVLAPLEHKRWCAEKLAAGFIYGPIPADGKTAKILLKDILKVTDQLMPFDKLDETNRKKDLDVFLILPMLVAIRQRLMQN